jgi:hypothetical protein
MSVVQDDGRRGIATAVNWVRDVFGANYREWLRARPDGLPEPIRRLFWHPFGDAKWDLRVHRARTVVAFDAGWKVPPCPVHGTRCQQPAVGTEPDLSFAPTEASEQVGMLVEGHDDYKTLCPPVLMRIRRTPSTLQVSVCDEDGREIGSVVVSYRRGQVNTQVTETAGGAQSKTVWVATRGSGASAGARPVERPRSALDVLLEYAEVCGWTEPTQLGLLADFIDDATGSRELARFLETHRYNEAEADLG